jgi:ABC-type branched-subunit amino acid transport system ATPase component
MTGFDDGLRTDGLTIAYGGHVAVKAVTLHAPRGRITGLIGPNGAGKTTTFNACSGLLAPTAGTVWLDAEDVTTLAPHRRAQLGLGRTYQRMELFDSLSVRANIELGREASLAGSRPWKHLTAGASEVRETKRRAQEAIDLCGIDALADQPVVALSTGQRRLVELARAVAGRKEILLLDEPSSGLDHAETDTIGDILLHLVATEGIGIFMVEHDMGLVMRICDYLYVLDFGEQIFEGTPREVRASRIVQAAYLGEELAA